MQCNEQPAPESTHLVVGHPQVGPVGHQHLEHLEAAQARGNVHPTLAWWSRHQEHVLP